MEDSDTIPKEVIIRLKDMQTKNLVFEKEHYSVFVQQDQQHVDVLVFTDENSHSVLSYNPESIIKFTLKNWKTSQIHGTSYLVMRAIKDMRKNCVHVLPLDGRTY